MPIPLLFSTRTANIIHTQPNNQKTVFEECLHTEKKVAGVPTHSQSYVASPEQARKLAVKELMGRKDTRSKLLAITIAISAKSALGPSFIFGTLHDYLQIPPNTPNRHAPEALRAVNKRFIDASRFLRGQEARFFLSSIEAQRRDAILTEPWALYIERTAAELGRTITGDLCVEAYEEPPRDSAKSPLKPIPGRLSATAKDMARKFGRHL